MQNQTKFPGICNFTHITECTGPDILKNVQVCIFLSEKKLLLIFYCQTETLILNKELLKKVP